MGNRHGDIHWSELMTRDVAAARDYYSRVCGWTIDTMPMPEGEYNVAKVGDDMVAGMMDMSAMPGMEDAPAHWFTYIAVADVDAAAAETKDAGGMVLRPPFDVPNVGRIVIVADPGGAAVGLMTPSEGTSG
ncbi:VOC family protein [Pseudaestuariivita atlantica]|uniref:VOC domain-containing protein n=1 Tax=Pseudaestuariivita atlantica TaxID=1317121 RepID=A0A0L1JMH5_9RHOB|nr:VOC family protein [Pseudaestuariivita atlantica]KNG92623.1 hypothetical protein ATO11_16515 [Pseudaestuariivita atlantica]